MIIIATRWATDDLVGDLLRDELNGGEKWEKLILPAINEQGEALWPERFNIDTLNIIKQTEGSFRWSALFQQEPTIKGGNRIKADNIQACELKDFPNTMYIRAWDLASSTKQRSNEDPDYTVGVLAGLTQINKINHLWIKDVTIIREEAPKRNKIIIDTANKDGVVVPVYVEAFGAYKDAFTELKQLLWGRCNVNASRPPGDKSVKASPLEPVFEAGNVHIIKNSNFDLFIKQLKEFPNSKHDDCVDSLGLAYYELSKPKSGILIT
jgi:predicted phage terminase large subunit-like protein